MQIRKIDDKTDHIMPIECPSLPVTIMCVCVCVCLLRKLGSKTWERIEDRKTGKVCVVCVFRTNNTKTQKHKKHKNTNANANTTSHTMPPIRRSKKPPPEGWELIEPIMDELDSKMREGEDRHIDVCAC